MDWIGIGVIIIGIAFLILVFLLIKPLNKLTGVIAGLKGTTDNLPQQVSDITSEVKTTISSTRDTLNQVTEQTKKLSPIFTIIQNAGEATRDLASHMAFLAEKMKSKSTSGSTFVERNNLEGIYGAVTLGYMMYQHTNTKKSDNR
ncbi:DUF948 domain-containing protein [Virgibacillus kekensis]|uniref:DUF948 domain-containing protein n=1 Tax=Virgibacillus kekensis TaxID=202261 RepID=A0ABV9DLA1_9BACI